MDLSGTSIVFVNNYPGPGLGGGETYLLALVCGCVDAGMQVTVACVPGSGLVEPASRAGAHVVEMPMGLGTGPSSVRAIRRLAKDRQADVLQGTGYLTNLLVRAGAGTTRARVVNTVQVLPDASLADGGSKLQLRARKLVERRGRGRVDAFVTVSRAVAEAVVAQGAPSERVFAIPGAVDAMRVRQEASLPPPAGLPQSPLVGVVARFEPVKGVEYFVQAAALLGDRESAARFVAAGWGSQESRLREKAFALGLAGRLSFVGRLPSVVPLLAALDVLVVPSLSEAFGLVALEAMALGIPVVASDVGGLAEIVVPGITGLLVPPADPAALADAVESLLDDTGRARKMGAAGLARAESEFSVGRMIDESLSLYSRLLAS